MTKEKGEETTKPKMGKFYAKKASSGLWAVFRRGMRDDAGFVYLFRDQAEARAAEENREAGLD